MTVEELLCEIERDRILYKHSGGGVTFSGGEPLLFPEFNKEVFRACKGDGISIGVDTCGHVPWTNIEQVLDYVDFFLWDIKHMDPEKHREYTGVSNELILSNLRRVSDRGIKLYIRMPMIPGYTDSEDNIRATCEFVLTLNNIEEVNPLPVHHLGKARYEALGRSYPIDGIALIPDGEMQRVREIVESYGLSCRLGG